jgi:predicted metal-dependent phosphoesterase TrpH
MTVDLHLHTNHSDGTWTASEMIEQAVKLKLRCIAITDHDTTAGISEGITAAAGRLEIINGVEINTRAEFVDTQKQDVHILGYFIDPNNQKLNELLKRQRDARVSHVEQVIKKLNDHGIGISMESIRRFTSGGPIGKPHITKAIVAAGGAADITQAYEKFMSKKSEFYIPRDSTSPGEAIQAIRHAGGIASIAHPGPGEHVRTMVADLLSQGLGAIEAYHQIHSAETTQSIIELAKELGLLITGGSDCHGPYEECPPSIGTVDVPYDVVVRLKAASTRLNSIVV